MSLSMEKHRPVAALVLTLLSLIPAAALANCRVSTTPLNFGNYQPGGPTPLDVAGEVTADCRGHSVSYSLSLSPGASGDAAGRYMTLATERLYYNIYLDAARMNIWGDGLGPTSLITGMMQRNGRQIDRHQFYGRVFSEQQPSAGTYVDSLVVTILF
ncbi:MAG TPA: spore coat U domain-containing protein [Woeseiaceae bacterium]